MEKRRATMHNCSRRHAGGPSAAAGRNHTTRTSRIMCGSIILLTLFFVSMGCASQKKYLEPLPTSSVPAAHSIDMRGKKITTVILYHAVAKLNGMKEGEVLEIATDNSVPIDNDLRAWLRMTGHGLTDLEESAGCRRYYVRKAASQRKKQTMAMVISNPGLEELLSPLGFALGAELAGIDVSIFFQGPAVGVLKKGFKEKLGGISSLFSGFARDGLAEIGHVGAQEKLRQIRELGGKLYVCGPSMEHFGVRQDDLIFDDVIAAEYMTFLEVMGRADIHVFLQ